MTENKNVPRIRFDGFNDAWEQRKLGDTETHFTDGNYGESYPSAKDMSDKANGIPFLRGSDFSNGYLDSSNANYIKPEKHAELTSGHIKQDDIVLVVRGSLGTLGYATKENEGWNINSQLAILRTNKSEISGMFLIQYLLGSKGQKEIFSRNTGTALKQLPIKQLKDIPVPVPTLLEQQKIGNFFKELDSTIALHQRKLDLLKEIKKSMMQKIFDQTWRFEGFTDPWEQRKLGDITTWTKGQGLSKEYLNNERYGSEAVHYADLYKFSPVMQEVIHWTNSDDGRIIPDNSLLFPASDVTPVGLARTSTLRLSGVKAGGDVIIGQLSERINSSFMSYQINANSKKILPLITGTTVRHVQAKSLATMSVTITNMAEQTAIAGLFERIDNLIALHQLKIDKLKEIKKWLMQNMFV